MMSTVCKIIKKDFSLHFFIVWWVNKLHTVQKTDRVRNGALMRPSNNRIKKSDVSDTSDSQQIVVSALCTVSDLVARIDLDA